MIPLNQGILDLGSIGEASNLSVINLAFNKLESLRGLSSLSNLATLNISHNQIT
jgi:Leucine-rich repeat (LRR) protein